MKICIVDGRAFAEVVDGYLLYIGEEKEVRGASIQKVQAMLNLALEAKSEEVRDASELPHLRVIH